MKTKKTKYKLSKRLATFTVVASLSSVLTSSSPSYDFKMPKPLESNITFYEELQEIADYLEIDFKNKELEKLIKTQLEKETLTKQDLLSIKTLTIPDTLSNTDISDLKYLINLEELNISNNNIDLEDIKYNQNLKILRISDSTIYNTEDIPNSVEYFKVSYTTIEDNKFVIPFYTNKITLVGTFFHNLTLKNPYYLKEFHLIGDSILDLESIADCEQLTTITLKSCSNISNSHILSTFPNLNKITLDDYAPIWLDANTIENIPLNDEQKDTIETETRALDDIAATIIATKNPTTEEESIAAISLFIIDYLQYDLDVLGDTDLKDYKAKMYNREPIKTSLQCKDGVCINYACLFKALCNRLNIESYRLFNEVHTWNIVKTEEGYKGYDLTNVDDYPLVKVEEIGELALLKDTTVQEIIDENKGSTLLFYEFDLDEIKIESLIPQYTPEEIESMIIEIGYLPHSSFVQIKSNDDIKTIKINNETKAILISILSVIGIYAIYKKINEKKYTKKKEVRK